MTTSHKPTTDGKNARRFPCRRTASGTLNHSAVFHLHVWSHPADHVTQTYHNTALTNCTIQSNRYLHCIHTVAGSLTACKNRQQKLVPSGTDGRLLLSGFQALVTLTLDGVTWHTVVHQSSTSIYIPNFIEIGKKLFVDVRMYGHTYWRTFQTASNVTRSTQRSWPNYAQRFFCKLLEKQN